MIETFFKDTITNIRRSTASPTGTDTMVTVSSFVGLLRPVDEVSKLYYANNVGKEYDIIADDSNNVLVGDNCYINGNKYSVLGVTTFEDLEDTTDSYLNIRVTR